MPDRALDDAAPFQGDIDGAEFDGIAGDRTQPAKAAAAVTTAPRSDIAGFWSTWIDSPSTG
jgi:hypothetical protein